MSLIESFSASKSVEVVAIADLDSNRLPKGIEAATKNQDIMPRAESDFRKLIDDKSIDALVAIPLRYFVTLAILPRGLVEN